MENGWYYPTYLYNYLYNPAALFLFDKIYIDREAAERVLNLSKWALKNDGIEARIFQNVNIKQEEVESLGNLLDFSLFEKINVESHITEEDYTDIKRNFYNDLWSGDFWKGVVKLQERYGPNYATPTPMQFEAMNVNLNIKIAEKLHAKPIDDVLRAPLYNQKFDEIIEKVDISEELYNRLYGVLNLPQHSILDIDVFKETYNDKRIIEFRRKIQEIQYSKMNANQISSLIQNENEKLKELNPLNWISILIGSAVFSVSINLSPSPIVLSTSSGGIFAAARYAWEELKTLDFNEKYKWLILFKGFIEKQEKLPKY